MSVVINPSMEPAVNATVTIGTLPVEVTFPSTQEISITGPNDTITPVDNTGAYIPLASAANQATANASLSSIDSKLTSPITVTGLLTNAELRNTAVPVSATSWPLPTGASTLAGQTTGNSTLNTISTKLAATIAVTQSGTWTVQPGNTANTTAWKVDGSAATQPVSAASLPLPSGAATSANQSTEITALGTINTTLGTPFQAGGSIGNTVFASTQSGVWNVGTVSTITNVVHVDDNGGSLTVDGSVTANAGTNLNTSLLALDSTVAKDASLTTLNTSVNALLKPANTLAAVTTVGTVSTITNVVHVDDNGSSLTVDNAGTFPVQATLTAETTKVIGTVNQGTSPWVTSGTSTVSGTIAATQSGTWTVSTLTAKPQYSASAVFLAAATATDVFTITGSVTKTIKILHIGINGINTGNTNILFNVIKRSTANSAGTATTLTNVPFDSADAAATAVVRSYTVNPTLGSAVGTLRVDYVFFPTLASTNAGTDIDFQFGVGNDRPIVLRGTGEVLALNLGGTLITGTTTLAIDITWTEE